MTAAEIIAARVAPFWLPKTAVCGRPESIAERVLNKLSRNDRGSSTNGALIVRDDRILVYARRAPLTPDSAVEWHDATMTAKDISAYLVADIRHYGPPVLAAEFAQGQLDIRGWVCCTEDEVTLNGPEGPNATVAMEDVAFLRGLPGPLREWRVAASTYLDAEADFSKSESERLYMRAKKLAAAAGMQPDAVLHMLHRLRRVPRLAYALAEPNGARQ